MNRLLDTVLVIVALCAVTITGLLIKREFFPASAVAAPRALPDLPPDRLTQLEGVGTPQGAPDARTRLVEFTDLQCPYCALFDDTVGALLDRNPGALRLLTIATPLKAIHPVAYPAAIAALCADRQGKFRAFSSAAYRAQAGISLPTLDTLATRVGLRESGAFAACRAEAGVAARVDSSLALADRLQIEATPTFYLDGHLVPLGTTPAQLATLVEARIAAAH